MRSISNLQRSAPEHQWNIWPMYCWGQGRTGQSKAHLCCYARQWLRRYPKEAQTLPSGQVQGPWICEEDPSQKHPRVERATHNRRRVLLCIISQGFFWRWGKCPTRILKGSANTCGYGVRCIRSTYRVINGQLFCKELWRSRDSRPQVVSSITH